MTASATARRPDPIEYQDYYEKYVELVLRAI